jgi:hypothetical protein
VACIASEEAFDQYIRKDEKYARQNKMAFHGPVLLSGI